VTGLSKSSAFLLLQLVAFWPVWRWYVSRLLDSSDEPWGLLALVTALLFIGLRGKEVKISSRQMIVSSVFLFVYLVTFKALPPLGRAFLAVMSIASILSPSRFGRSVHIGIIGLLLLSLPIIASLQFYLGYPVRFVTAIIASKLITLTGYYTTAAGTCLSWAGEIISIDAPCAGIRMLWTGLYLNFTLACFNGLNTIRTWLTYSLSMLIIFTGNVMRVTALFYMETGILHGPPWIHNGIGLVAFTAVTLAIVSLHSSLKKAEGGVR